MQDEATVFADPNDRASQESDMALELRNRDRERKNRDDDDGHPNRRHAAERNGGEGRGQDRDQVARTLQRSLLPPDLPAPPAN